MKIINPITDSDEFTKIEKIFLSVIFGSIIFLFFLFGISILLDLQFSTTSIIVIIVILIELGCAVILRREDNRKERDPTKIYQKYSNIIQKSLNALKEQNRGSDDSRTNLKEVGQ